MRIPESLTETQTFFVKNKISIEQTQSNLYLTRTLQIIDKVKTLYEDSNLRVLDLGCGHGYNTCIMGCLLTQSRITGVDYIQGYKKTWNLIRTKGFKTNFVNSDARSLPFEDSSFDIVITWGLLEHIGEERTSQISYKEIQLEEQRCVREVYRVLRPNGFFVLNYLPNKYSYIEFITNHFKTYSHAKKFTKREISSLLGGNHFQLIDISRVHLVPSLYHIMGDAIGNVLNKSSNLLYSLDRLLLRTPICLLAQDFEVVAKKKNDSRLE
jgi:ubiquinone/menaquinone biosynthesis C-methylase UbiE